MGAVHAGPRKSSDDPSITTRATALWGRPSCSLPLAFPPWLATSTHSFLRKQSWGVCFNFLNYLHNICLSKTP